MCPKSKNGGIPDWPENTNLVEDQPIRGQEAIFVFHSGRKNTKFVGDIAIFLLVKFCWIPFNIFKGVVENVWTNRKPGPAILLFWSVRQKKTW